ncbi:DUF4244 domain-containing protein [Arthrobacter cryoconiti]|uniref:DUF4244 domain-containing protein n=1 Tax=Arthrobacter cryoconiti TaxID=748907 RepID=A0ABV8R2A1_9MICC|nr:DUF4244 domain-containing protein [Arthrobacter cryoconiti]MCC9068055.1 DUF4244 domain-containing protein [Arthrobacter cryoconiti]
MRRNEVVVRQAARIESSGHENVREIFPGAASLIPVTRRRRLAAFREFGAEAGMATAEYAIATLAAVGFAGLLVVILKSDEVRGFLLNIIRSALSF